MKVNDYVRTKYGEICQLKEPKYNGLIYSTDIEIDRYNDRDCNDYGFDNDTIKDIIKTAEGTPKGLLSLIEVGDYVNGARVTNFMFDGDKKIGVFVEATAWGYDANEIKSIVTKEQFESMEYRL